MQRYLGCDLSIEKHSGETLCGKLTDLDVPNATITIQITIPSNNIKSLSVLQPPPPAISPDLNNATQTVQVEVAKQLAIVKSELHQYIDKKIQELSVANKTKLMKTNKASSSSKNNHQSTASADALAAAATRAQTGHSSAVIKQVGWTK
jgi:hypothetical protein